MSERLLTLAEVANRLGGISIYTVKERIREAGIRGPRPAREMMLTEDDYRRLVENMRLRQRGDEPGHPHGTSLAAKRAMRDLRLRETKRMGKRIKGQPVVALNLERPPNDK